jgi:hypothetical protein
MAKTLSTEPRFVFLGSKKGLFEGSLSPRVSVCRNRSEVDAMVRSVSRRATYISFNRTFTDFLIKGTVDLGAQFQGSNLLTLIPPRLESIPALLGLFQPVFGLIEGFRWLPSPELVAVILRDDVADRFIGGNVDSKTKTLTLLRGNMKTVIAPFSVFPTSGDATKPDFTKLGFTDYGRTIVLGPYEASADAVLYELDPDYRRQLKKQRRSTEQSFGASLRRLRKQRRLKRTDFGPVSSKEIARIERNEVAKPHAKTLAVLANRLGVRPQEIGSY